MNSGDDVFRERRFDELTTPLADAKFFSQQRLRGSRAEADQHFWFQNLQFCFQPRAARGNFPTIRLLVNTPLASWLPLEVLDGIRHIDFVTVDACFDESFVQELSRGTDERFPRQIFVVARLFAYKNDFGVARAFAKN